MGRTPVPQSVMIRELAGIKNTVSEERLRGGKILLPGEQQVPLELSRAINIDIDDALQGHRRRGYTLKAAGNFHSLTATPAGVFVVKDGVLGRVNPDYTFESLGVDGGDDLVSFVEIASTVYFSSADVSGKIVNGVVQPWGTSGGGTTWLSPVINPSVTLPEVKGKLLRKPPMATALCHSDGRIWLAQGNLLWCTELWLYDYIDATRNFFQFESPITALGAVEGGFYVGTENACYFMKGPLAQKERRSVLGAGVYRGSMVNVPAPAVRPERNESREALMFMSTQGVCIGLDAGTSYVVTEGRVEFPPAVTAAAMFREQDGMSQYVGVLDHRGTPGGNMRIGDYVDAEIRRHQG